MADEFQTTLPFSVWLQLEETPLFTAFEPCGLMRWLLDQEPIELSSIASAVNLLKIEGKLYKLDGKHLKQAFLAGHKGLPEVLYAKTYEANTAVIEKLTQRLGDMAKEEPLSPQDEIKLIYNDLGLVFTTDRIRNGFISEALNIVFRGHSRIYQDKREQWRNEIDMKKAVTVLRDELKMIDALNLKSKLFNTGVLSACLIMMSLKNEITPFIVQLNNEAGKTKDDKYDPVECVLRAIKRYKESATAARRRGTLTLCQITIQAIMLWLQGADSANFWSKYDLEGVDHIPLVMKLRHIKGLHEAIDI